MKKLLILIFFISVLSGCALKATNISNDNDIKENENYTVVEITNLQIENENLKKQLQELQFAIDNEQNNDKNKYENKIEILENKIGDLEIEIIKLKSDKNDLTIKLSEAKQNSKIIENNYNNINESIQEFLFNYYNNSSKEEFSSFIKHTLNYNVYLYKGTIDDYTLLDNNISLNETIYIDAPNFLLSLSEHLFLHNYVEEYYKLLNIQRLDSFTNHIELINYDNYEEHFGSGFLVDSKIFYIKDVPTGTTLTFKISQELAEWLDIDSINITIVVEY